MPCAARSQRCTLSLVCPRLPMPTLDEGRSPAQQPCESAWFQALFPFPVSARELRGTGVPDWLLPAERDSLGGAVPTRIQEFAAGRRCAREAMQALGVAPQRPLLRGPQRQPLWPAGVVGSITHTKGYCAAVVAPASACAGLGIDAERCADLDAELWPRLFDAAELSTLGTLEPEAARQLSTVLFAVKEAFFKSQFPLSAAMPDFTEVSFRLCAPLGPQGALDLLSVRDARLSGLAARASFRYALRGPWALAAAAIQHAAAQG